MIKYRYYVCMCGNMIFFVTKAHVNQLQPLNHTQTEDNLSLDRYLVVMETKLKGMVIHKYLNFRFVKVCARCTIFFSFSSNVRVSFALSV